MRRATAGVATAGVVVALLVVNVPSAWAVVGICEAQDVTSGGSVSADLQEVIDAAGPGDMVEVKGACVGKFTIRNDLTVVGKPTQASPVPTLDGDSLTKVLRIRGRATEVTLTDLTITNGTTKGSGAGIDNKFGTVTLSGSTSVTGNRARGSTGYGGGIYNYRGSVTLNDSSSATGNRADVFGGGIYNYGRLPTNQRRHVTLNDSSSISGNVAGLGGGGIYVVFGKLTLNDSSSVTANSAGIHRRGAGGGIKVEYGSATLNDSSSVTANHARSGGGISFSSPSGGEYGTLTLSGSSSIADNTARYGGGVYNDGPATLREASSVTDNTASASGGGVYNRQGTVSACDGIGVDEWIGAISPNTPEDSLTPTPITCS